MIAVLYVDDEPDLLTLAQLFLEQDGEFSIRTATSAREILKSPEIRSYDAIVSDYQMPEMNGIEFLKAVREQVGTVPFILFTGRGREEVVIDAINNGADFYLQKGGDPTSQFAELAHKIRQAVLRKRAELELKKKNDELNASYEQIAAAEEELRQQLDELSENQAALKESEERFRAFTENIPDLTTIVDRRGVHTYVSPSIQRITGWRVDDLREKKFAEVDAIFGMEPEDIVKLQESGRLAMQQPGNPVPVAPFRLRDVKGDTHYIEGSHTYLPDVKGIQGIVFHGRDVTDRVRAEEELRRKNEELNASYEQITAAEEELRGQYDELVLSEKRIRASEEELRLLKFSVDHAHDEVFWMDFSGKILYVNEAACRVTGYSQEELQAMKIFELDPNFPPEVWTASVADLREKKAQLFTTRHRCKDGWIIDVEISSAYINNEGAEYSIAFVRDVSERKRAQEALCESEEKFRTLVETSCDFIWEVDKQGTYTYISPKIHDMLGYDPAELIGKTPFDLMPPEEAARVIIEFNRYMEARKPFAAIENINIAKDGSRVILETNGIPWYTKEGTFAGYRGIDRDITARRLAEATLRENEAQYKRIFESFVDIYYEVDKDGIIRVISPSATAITGWQPEELMGKSILMLYYRESDRPRILEQVAQNASVTNFNVQLKKRDGTPVSTSVNARIRYSPTGEPDGILGSIRDVTETLSAQKALRASEEKYRNILENLQDAYIRTDNTGHITMVSPSAARMYGYGSPDEMIGQLTESLYMNPERRKVVLQKLQDGGRVIDATGESRRKDGTSFWVSINIQYLFDEAKNIIGAEAIVRDITERKSMEHAIREANKKLNLLSSITRHDIVNQLTMLQGYTQLAAMKNPDPVVADFLAKIERSAGTIMRQIGFTKAYQELGVKSPAWFRLDRVCTVAGASEVRPAESCREIEIFADPLIERVFYNLVDNARRHGGHVTEIAVRCEQVPDGLLIVVEDNGVGIPPEEKEKIFGKGYGKNSGFGLFLTREILAITGITIRETGYLGVGARFEITVPPDAFRIAAEP